MGSKVLGLLFFAAIIAVVALNFHQLLTFSQERMLSNEAEKAIEARNWEKAIGVYRTGLRQYPDNTSVALKLGWLYEQNGQPGQAEKVYRNILDTRSGSLEARIGLVNVLKTDPLRINEAVDELRKALDAHPDNAVLLSQAGNLYKSAAENPGERRKATRKALYDYARYYYQLSLRENPKQFQTRFNLGVTFQNLGNKEEAAKAYCQSLVLSPDSYEGRFNLGLVLSDMNYLDEAYRQMERSVEIATERDDIGVARQVAQKVQNVKNAIYSNPDRHGLSSNGLPEFLDAKCLLKAKPEKP